MRRRLVPAAFFAFLLVTVLGCGPTPGPQASLKAEERAQELFSALQLGDVASLRRLGPAFEEVKEDHLRELGNRLTTGFDWRVGEATVDGRRAVVPVSLVPTARGAPSTDEIAVVVPLRWRSGAWVIADTLQFTQTIDVVPVSPDRS